MNTRFSTFLLLLAALPLLALGCKKASPKNNNTNNANTSQTNTVTIIIPANQNRNTPPTNSVQVNTPPQETELRRLSVSFAERYGSYSNQSDYANLENLLVFMTVGFAKQTSTYIESQRARHLDTGVYYGITTKVVSVETNAFDDGKGNAEFFLTTQRKESVGSTNNARTFQQNLIVTMSRENTVWKVSQANWQKTQ